MNEFDFDPTLMLQQLEGTDKRKEVKHSFPVLNGVPEEKLLSEQLRFAYQRGAVSPGNPCTVCRNNSSNNLRAHFHGSEFNACSRRVFYDIMHPTVRTESTNGAFLLDGHTHEMLVLKALERGLKSEGIEFELIRAQNNAELVYTTNTHMAVIGHYDGVLKINGDAYVLECKAVKENTWREVTEKGIISDIWYGQMQFYMMATGIHKAILLLKNRTTSVLHKPLIFAYDENFCLSQLEGLRQVWMIINGVSKNPYPFRKHQNKNNKECRYCDHALKCWEVDRDEA